MKNNNSNQKYLALLLILVMFVTSGCAAKTVTTEVDGIGEVRVITDKMFIAQINDIYLNIKDYMHKAIKYQGVFAVYEASEAGDTYYAILRYGPGCCGSDGNVGFEVVWDGEYPSPDEWVECIGTVETAVDGGVEYVYLKLSSLKVLEERGEEFVTQ